MSLATVSQTASVVLVGAFVVGLLVFVWRRERGRGRLAPLARRLHLNYTRVDAHGLWRRFRELELLRQGHNRYLCDVVSGSTRLGPVHCFRYRYERGFGVDRCTYRWLVATLEVAHPVGDFCVRYPGSRGDRPAPPLVESNGSATKPDSGRVDSEVGPGGDVRAWHESLAIPAALECRDHLISLQVVDEGSEAQYEGLLEAIQQGGSGVVEAEC